MSLTWEQKEKLKRVQALTNSPNKNEAEVAKLMLAKLKEKYGSSDDYNPNGQSSGGSKYQGNNNRTRNKQDYNRSYDNSKNREELYDLFNYLFKDTPAGDIWLNSFVNNIDSNTIFRNYKPENCSTTKETDAEKYAKSTMDKDITEQSNETIYHMGMDWGTGPDISYIHIQDSQSDKLDFDADFNEFDDDFNSN
jgi:hypothetical protein